MVVPASSATSQYYKFSDSSCLSLIYLFLLWDFYFLFFILNYFSSLVFLCLVLISLKKKNNHRVLNLFVIFSNFQVSDQSYSKLWWHCKYIPVFCPLNNFPFIFKYNTTILKFTSRDSIYCPEMSCSPSVDLLVLQSEHCTFGFSFQEVSLLLFLFVWLFV